MAALLCHCPGVSPTFLLHVQTICAAEALALQVAAFAAPWFAFTLLIPSGPGASSAVTYALHLSTLLVTPAGGPTTDLFAASVAPQYQTLGRVALAFLVLAFLCSLALLACCCVRAAALALGRPAAAWPVLPRAFAALQAVDSAALALLAWLSALCSGVGLALGCSFISAGNTGSAPVAAANVDYTGRTCAIFALLAALLAAALATRAHLLSQAAGEVSGAPLPWQQQPHKAAVTNPLSGASSVPQENAAAAHA